MISLRKGCKDAALALLGQQEPEEGQMKGIDGFAEKMSEILIEWLTQQTFTITEMKAALRVDSIKTQGPLQGDVQPFVTVEPGIPSIVDGLTHIGATTSKGPVGPTGGRDGVLMPKIDYSFKGGQGGLMTTTGFSYIGPNPTGITNENLTKVKLLKDNVVGE